MELKKLTATQSLALLGIATLLAMGGLYYFVLVSIESTRAELTTAVAERDIREARKLDAEKARKLVEATRDMRAEIGSYFVTTEEMIVFLDTLESLGPSVGVEYETESVGVVNGDDQVDPGVRSVALVEGSWDALYTLVNLIEHMPYAVTITKIVLEQNEEDKSLWSGQVHLYVRSN